MPFVSREELDELHARNNQLQEQVSGLQQALTSINLVRGVSEQVQARLGELRQAGVIDEAAASMATFEITEQEKDRITREAADSLKKDEYDRTAAKVRAEEGPGIIASIKQTFEADGTFASIRDKAKVDTVEALQSEIIDEYTAKVRAGLDTPEAKVVAKEKAAADFAASPEAKKLRATVRSELEGGWTKEAQEEVKAEITAEEEDREENFKADYKKKLGKSDNMKDLRQRKRYALERTWIDKTSAELAEAIGSEELNTILTKRIELEAAKNQKIEDELTSQELLKQFEGAGINTDEIPVGASVSLLLGTTGTIKVRKKDQWGNWRDKEVPGIVCVRKIELLAKDGAGHFEVRHDTLSEAKSKYDQNDAFSQGTTVTVGRYVKTNGHAVFEHTLVAGANLVMDDDDSTEAATDTLYPICNVVINNCAARDLEVVEDLIGNK